MRVTRTFEINSQCLRPSTLHQIDIKVCETCGAEITSAHRRAHVDISAKGWGNSLSVLKDIARIHKKGADKLIFTPFFRCIETQTEVCKES